MALVRQRIEIPLGVGVERKTQEFVATAAKVRESQNTVFSQPGSVRKRLGEAQVGTTLSTPQRALVSRAGQLGVAGYDGFRYLKESTQDFVKLPSQQSASFESVRPIPCKVTSRKVRGDVDDLTSPPHSVVSSGKIVHSWMSRDVLGIKTSVTIRCEDEDGSVVIPDREVIDSSMTRSDDPRSHLAAAANGAGKVRVWYRKSPGISYVDVDVSGGTIGTPTVLTANVVSSLAAVSDPASSDHVYFIYYDGTAARYEVRRINLTTGAVTNTANITLGVALAATANSRATLYAGSDGKLWAWTTEGAAGTTWRCTVYQASSLTIFRATGTIAFTTYGAGAIHHVALAQKASDANVALILAEHRRDAAENPTNSTGSILRAYTLDVTTAFTLTTHADTVANCRLAGRGFSITHSTTHYPFFLAQTERDIDLYDATYGPGTLQDFDLRTSMLLAPHYPSDASTTPRIHVVGRYAVDLESYGAVPMSIASTRWMISHVTRGAPQKLAQRADRQQASIRLTSFDFDPTNTPSEDLEGIWFGLGHQYLWSGSELVDGVCPAIPGPPLDTASSGAGSTYRYRVVWEWEADDGSLVRSHASPPSRVVTNVFPAAVTLQVPKPPAVAANGSTNKTAFTAIYRTSDAQLEPYKLVDRLNNLSNSAIANKPGFWEYSDTTLSVSLGATLYVTGDRLNAEPAPPFTDFTRVGDRVWGLDGQDDHRVWPSLVLEEGTAPEWNYILTVRLPGALVAVEELAGRPLLLGGDGVWTVYGDGPSNAGLGAPFQPVEVTSSYGAVSSSAVARTPLGVVFQSSRGLCIATADMQCAPWGVEVDPIISGLTVSRIVHVESVHQIRIYSEEGTVLVFDTISSQWSTWTGMDAQELMESGGEVFRLETGAGSQDVWREDSELPSSTPSEWQDVGSPTAGTGAWRSMLRGDAGRLHAVADDGTVGYRPVGSAWVTQTLSIPDIDLDANVASTVNLAGFKWTDTRDAAKNLAWPSLGVPPTYPAAITSPSGLPVIDCSSITTTSVSGGTTWVSLIPAGSQYTGYCVFRAISAPAGSLTAHSVNDAWVAKDSSGSREMGLRVFSVGAQAYVGWIHRDTVNVKHINKTINVGTWYLVGWYYNGATLNLQAGGVAATPVAATAWTQVSGGNQLCHQASTPFYVAQIRLWRNLLSASQRAAQETALRNKWGVT